MANITIAGFPPQATLDKEDIIHVSRNGVDYRSTVGAASKDLPVGFIYTQLPNKQSPSELGLVGTWTNISSSFAGNFFRVEGGNASIFESGEQADKFQGHRMTLYADVDTAGDNANPSNRNIAFNAGTSYVYKDSTGGGANGAMFPGGVRDFITDGTNGTPRTGIETNPVNETIRLWERTA